MDRSNNDIDNVMFIKGDIIINEEFSVIGAYSHESIDTASGMSWPTFSIAVNNGKIYLNFDDIECDDWPGDYRYASDEEVELFLKAIEDYSGFVWNPLTETLEERDESTWRLPKYVYPQSWEEAEKIYDECERYTQELFVVGDEEGPGGIAYTLGKLILLRDIYRKNNDNVDGEISYAIIKTKVGENLECRPFIFGSRNSMFSFRYQEQARLFMTNFEDLLKICIDLL